MMATYWWRLICLALACFFLTHLAASAAVALLASRALLIAERFKPRSAALALFLLRIFPLAFSVFSVMLVCVPSYIWLEPHSTTEQVGWLCLLSALLGMLICLISIGRFLHAITRSYRYMQRWRHEGRASNLGEATTPALVIQSDVPFLALAGIVRPTMIASRALLRTLTTGQLAACLRHEEAHLSSHDNLKRLIVRCAPQLLPFVSAFEPLERGWIKFAERAADDRAVAGDPTGALLLAEALVRVARSGGIARATSLAAPLLADRSELHARVYRLLHPTPQVSPAGSRRHVIALATVGVVSAMLLEPVMLRAAHQLFERLIR